MLLQKIKTMKITLKPNELILKVGNAKLYQNNEKIKGKLIAATQTLYFITLTQEHKKFNKELVYSEIKEIDFFNTMLIIPNGLTIKTKSCDLSFIINDRNKWSEIITKMF
jgi:hypothetical protein